MDSSGTSKTFPGFGHVFSLGETGSDRIFRSNLDLADEPYLAVRGEVDLSGPVRARWTMGRSTPEDVIWTELGLPLLSGRLIELLSGLDLTGWASYRVILCGRNGEDLPGYRGLVVTGRCGVLDESRSTQVIKQFPARSRTIRKGLYFEPESWDGTDLFMPQGRNGWIFVTAKVKDALNTLNIPNIRFTALSEIELTWLS